MPKQNGGVVGPTNNPTSGVASGVWDMDEQYAARLTDSWPGMSMQATGGIEVTSGTNKWHIFTSSGSFNVTSAGLGLVDVLVVAGGGTGGDANDNNGSGGGGGGVVFRPANPIVAANYPITVGAGTASAPYPNTNNAGPGGNSQFGTSPQTGYLKANGGGSGNPSSGVNPNAAANGGSGGGGGGPTFSGGTGNQPSEPGDSGLYGYGQPGGSAGSSINGGSGGGGGQAGATYLAAGGNGALIPAPFMDPALPTANTGNIPSSDPSWRYFGGGGGTGNNPGLGGPGGAGGLGQIGTAGQGGNSAAGDGYGRAGQALRGGGGGGNGDTTGAGSNPGAGGPGIVIVRYSTV